jgi:hypothetical protein
VTTKEWNQIVAGAAQQKNDVVVVKELHSKSCTAKI